MKLTTEQLASWFYTVNSSFFQEGAEAGWLDMLNSRKGRERSAIVSGMKQGLNDTLTMTKDWPPDRKEQVDARLASKGLPSLLRMQVNLKKKHVQILKRGRIRNDEEYYIVAEILSDMEFDITDQERVSLEEIHFTYEQAVK